MPTYEYHCSSCNASYELRQGFDASTEHLCEECKKGTAKRVLHAPRVLFKGSGFYVTDSKSKSVAASDAPSSNGTDSSKSTETAPSPAPAAPATTDTSSAS